jgi:Ca2+-transporting ATPase
MTPLLSVWLEFPLCLGAIGVAGVGTVALQRAVIYLPPAQALFKTQALSPAELAACFAAAAIVFLAVEAEKWLRRRGLIYRESKGG